MSGLLTPARVDQSARQPGGVLSKALPAPAGWERGGLVIPFYACGEPVLRDKCIEAEDTPHRSESADFPAIPIEQGAVCSTSGPDSQEDQAFARWSSTVDWALGRQLQTDQAALGSPKLDDAALLTTVTGGDFKKAAALLEQHMADTGFGVRWMLHAPVFAADYLADVSALDPATGLSANGAQWIISAGYRVHPSTPATKVRLYGTGQVWASAGEPSSVEGTAYRKNDQEAWARGVGVVAFDPCMLAAIDVTL